MTYDLWVSGSSTTIFDDRAPRLMANGEWLMAYCLSLSFSCHRLDLVHTAMLPNRACNPNVANGEWLMAYCLSLSFSCHRLDLVHTAMLTSDVPPH